MRILIATPLYPPDIAEPAPYVKELATRLKDMHKVTVLAYNHIPEQILGVHIIAIPKYTILPVRLIRYTYRLWKEASAADYVFMQNGPSTELPLVLISHFTKSKYIFHLGDEISLSFALNRVFRKLLLIFALKSADIILTHQTSPTKELGNMLSTCTVANCNRPKNRPEILPFSDYPTEAFRAYENSWVTHIADIQNIFTKHESIT